MTTSSSGKHGVFDEQRRRKRQAPVDESATPELARYLLRTLAEADAQLVASAKHLAQCERDYEFAQQCRDFTATALEAMQARAAFAEQRSASGLYDTPGGVGELERRGDPDQ